MKKSIEVSFQKFDSDKNGYLDRMELRTFLISFFDHYKLKVPINEEFCDDAFKEIDTNNDGKI